MPSAETSGMPPQQHPGGAVKARELVHLEPLADRRDAPQRVA